MAELDRRLLPYFTRQHWLVGFANVEAEGGTRHQVEHRLATGHWERRDRNVFGLAGAPVTWETKVLAPILATGGSAVASHRCAAAIFEMPGFGRGVPELTVARGARLRRAGALIHESTDLDRCRIVSRNGIPVTEMPRRLLDLARRIGDRSLARKIEWAGREGFTSSDELARTLSVHARRGRPGIRRLRRLLLADESRTEVTDSDLEFLTLSLIREHGLPEPVMHHRVEVAGRFVAEVDHAYPDLKIAIEVDGDVHLQPAVKERDGAKRNDLAINGWLVICVTRGRLRGRPDAIIREIRAAIAARTSGSPVG